jgi:integrase
MKRKDKYGRLLHKGESQRSNGTYSFRKSKNGKKIIEIYSPTLEELREKEKEINLMIGQGVDIIAAQNMTINDGYIRYCTGRTDWREQTKITRESLYKNHIKGTIGRRKLKDIKHSDVTAYYIDLMTEKGLGAGTVNNINEVLSIIYKAAINDQIVIFNPVVGACTEAKRKTQKKIGKRHALTEQEQTALVNYLDQINSRWKPLIVFLLGTGCRIGEAAALTWSDIDFNKNEIRINKTLGRKTGGFYINPPKTSAGCRVIPMFSAVRFALIEQRKAQLMNGVKAPEVDGFKNFVFTTERGKVINSPNISTIIHGITDSYNAEEKQRAEAEGRKPKYIRPFSAHCLRHTFASRLCSVESDIKLIASIMGHTDIKTTLNIYAEVSGQRKHDTFNKLDGKLQIM